MKINWIWVGAVAVFGIVLSFSEANFVASVILFFMFSAADLFGSPEIKDK